jgi:hypothetical protein
MATRKHAKSVREILSAHSGEVADILLGIIRSAERDADRVAAIKLYVEITDGSDQGADLAALLAEAVAD